MNIYVENNNSISNQIANANENDVIYIKKGIYKEKIVINNDNITIIGEGEDTIIENMDYFHKILPDHNECNTFRPYTVYVSGNNVTIKNLTIRNTSTPSSKYGQAVALYVDGDNFSGVNLNIESAQDTLFCGPLPHDLIERYTGFLLPSQLRGLQSHQKYKNCKISGDVDFIFGCGTVLFDKCDIISIGNGYLTAPAHYEEIETGFVFNECNIISKGANNVYLGRPWRDYGYAAFINCNYGTHINPNGFSKWPGANRHEHARFYEYSKNRANRAPFVKELSDIEKDKILKLFK